MNSSSINRPNLQALVTPKLQAADTKDIDPLEAHRRAMAAQDKYNLSIKQVISPLVSPIVWNPLTPTNGWVNYGGNNTTPGWAWDPFKWRVWLKGTIKSGTVSSTVSLFSNFVPLPSHIADMVCGTNTGAGELIVRLTGAIVLVSGGNGFLLLDGLSYDPAA